MQRGRNKRGGVKSTTGARVEKANYGKTERGPRPVKEKGRADSGSWTAPEKPVLHAPRGAVCNNASFASQGPEVVQQE